jgi:hypothetical protein
MRRWFVAIAVCVVGASAVSTTIAAQSRAACAWPSVIQGRPGALGSSAGGDFLWRVGTTWHLRVRGSRAVGARIAAGGIHIVRVLGPASAKVAAGALSLDAGSGTTLRGVDFTSSCAKPLSVRVKLSSGASQATTFLGAQTHAPLQHFRVTLNASNGVSGQLEVGPLCPVEPCSPSSKPAQGTIEISTAPSSRSDTGGGQEVAKVNTDSNGNFSASLPPGHYVATVTQSSANGTAKSTVFDVVDGVVTDIVVLIDTGIR